MFASRIAACATVVAVAALPACDHGPFPSVIRDAVYPGDGGHDAGHADGGMRGTPLGRYEVCSNGIDDNQNGVIDEGCVCTVGSTSRCYPGWPATAGVGACAYGVQVCIVAGPAGAWGECTGAVPPTGETCNGLDDNCDGEIDENCLCDAGTTQTCFDSSPAQAGVGRCVAGQQTCTRTVSALDGTASLGWDACVGAPAPMTEICNGIDDDCNGLVDDIPEICDFVDNDCDGLIDEDGACSALPAAYYVTRYWPPTGSGIFSADAPLYDESATTPSTPGCPPGALRLEDSPGHIVCAPMPPTCPPGTRYSWVDDAWECVRCDVIVQFGNIYLFERTCAPAPPVTCGARQTATYDVDTRAWECTPGCSSGYDPAYSAGTNVCVPC